jgi:predicted Zn-dependent protease
MRKLAFLLLPVVLFYGCAINPVTGDRELSLISESQEISIGQKNYGPSRQMQGGDYTVNPELSLYVNTVGQKLARASDRKLPYEFVGLNNSIPNAWALPGGKIAVNRGLLLELQSEAELAAVLGHEIVHAAARHGAKSMERGMLLQGALIATGIAVQSNDYANLVVGGAKIAAGLVHTKYGRDAELEADYYGMLYMSRAGYDPMAAIGLQETFIRLNESRSHNWLAGLFSSHPPSVERVEANRITAAKLPKGGLVGKDIYNKRIASLIKDKEGYESYVKGREAIQKGENDKALSFARKAISVQPREGHFYALSGDVHLNKKEYSKALEDFNQAVDLNRKYFYYYLQRGLTKKKLMKTQEAYADLQASTRLLPTAMAYNSLGEIEMSAGSLQKAKEYFKEASGSDSPAGEEARLSFLRLDFPENPDNYIKVQVGLTRKGYVFARIINNAQLSIRDISLAIQYPESSGRKRQTTRFISVIIPSGQSYTTDLDLGPYPDTSILGKVRIQITGVQLVEK